MSADFAGARLAYAAGWPELTNIAGTMLFHGERMVIQGKRANSLGRSLATPRPRFPT